MRIVLAGILVALAGSAAFAQQPGRPGEGSGLGPGQPPPSSTVKTTEPPRLPGTACDPSFGGKYAGLIRQLPIPEDEGQYGKCRDYGAWSGNEYKGHSNLPPTAFWTYSAPNWYLWSRQGPPPGPTQSEAGGGCPDPTFGGKYAQELRRIEVPQDRGQYGACNDYGEWSGTAYEGHANLPSGYWVYSFPHWIIYAIRGGAPKQ